MAFYIYNLGAVSGQLQEYADMNGMIPEKGDKWQDFRWPHSNTKAFKEQDEHETLWQEFLSKAIAATIKACEQLQDLQW